MEILDSKSGSPSVHLGVCVPTIRDAQAAEFLRCWLPLWRDNVRAATRVEVFMHEDRDTKTITFAPFGDIDLTHTCRGDLTEELGPRHWIIPRGSGACRSFPMYLAWRAGCDFVITLDDDCLPLPEETGAGFLASHLAAFTMDRWFRTVDGEEPRGIPYRERGALPVLLNHGLWTDHADLDGPTSMYHLRRPTPVSLPAGRSVVPPGMWFPLCAMNVCYHRSAIPAAYNLLMGFAEYGFDRYDDIWSGLFLKRIADHLQLYITSGEPFVRHAKASDAFVNNRREALGLQLHEYFWRHVAAVELSGTTIAGCYAEMADWVDRFPARCTVAAEMSGYFGKLAQAMRVWLELFGDLTPAGARRR